jgi:two-component system, OmpR family, response regulator
MLHYRIMADLPKLLMVEDDPNIRIVSEMCLEAHFKLLLAESGQEALEICQRETPDVILLDIHMPGMSGITTLAKLREIDVLKEVPIIFLTASVQTQEVEEYSRYDVQGVLRKPFDPMKLPKDIKKIIQDTNSSS